MSITHLHACMLLWTSAGVTCVVKCNVYDYPFVPYHSLRLTKFTEAGRSQLREVAKKRNSDPINYVPLTMQCWNWEVWSQTYVCQFCQYLNSPLRVSVVLISNTLMAHKTCWTKLYHVSTQQESHTSEARGTLPWTLNVTSENPTWSLTLHSCCECTL